MPFDPIDESTRCHAKTMRVNVAGAVSAQRIILQKTMSSKHTTEGGPRGERRSRSRFLGFGTPVRAWYNPSMGCHYDTGTRSMSRKTKRTQSQSTDARRDRHRAPHMLGLLVACLLLLACGLAGCATEAPSHEKDMDVSELLTVLPDKAATLTAWPSPAPIITRPPTLTPAPRLLWEAPPEYTSAQITPVHSPSSPTPVRGEAEAPEPTPAPSLPVIAAPPGTKPPTRLLIPSLALEVPVVEVSWDAVLEGGAWKAVWQTATSAAGHHRNSANPGEAGNVVISGHHNTAGEVFREVSEIGQPGSRFGLGDEIILVAQDGLEYSYRVSAWDRFPEEDASEEERIQHARYLDQTPEPILTLVTCWPYESRTHRVVVVAELQP